MPKKTLLVTLIIIIFASLGTKALFSKGFYTSHDGEHQVIRLYHFNQALLDGQFPPRWAGTADNGYGYPLFIFSYQSPWFIGVPLLKLGFPLTDAVKGVFILGFLASGIVMFLWLKEMISLLPGLTGAILYLWAPYRFSNIFVRASLGEATAFLFIPLFFWGIWELKDEEKWKKGIFLTATGLAGIILSHLMILVVFFLPILLWSIIQLKEAENKNVTLKKIIFSFLLGLALSAYYLIPAIAEKNYTQANQALSSQYQDHFVTLSQLVYSKWGYGFDFPGSINDEMSFQVGITQWVSVALLTVMFIVSLIKRKKADLITSFSLLTFGFSLFMMLSVSKPLWELITKYAYFDFPWRFLSLSVFSVSLGAALLVSHYEAPRPDGRGIFSLLLRRERNPSEAESSSHSSTSLHSWFSAKGDKKASVILGIFLIIIALYTNRNHLRVNQYVYHDNNFYAQNIQTTNQFDEYRPKTVDNTYLEIKRRRFESDSQKIKIINRQSRSNYLLIEGDAKKETKVKLNITYYPGWKVFLNNREQNDIKTEAGIMEVKVPKGKFRLEAKFTNTPLRTVANSITVIAAATTFSILIKKSHSTQKIKR